MTKQGAHNHTSFDMLSDSSSSKYQLLHLLIVHHFALMTLLETMESAGQFLSDIYLVAPRSLERGWLWRRCRSVGYATYDIPIAAIDGNEIAAALLHRTTFLPLPPK